MDQWACLIFSRAGLAVADRLLLWLKVREKAAPGKCSLSLYLPVALWQRMGAPADIIPMKGLHPCVEKLWTEAQALIFIGATGIAVRAIAPFLRHKSIDPPVIVIDPSGHNVISLISGHWGGANNIARSIARSIGANAIITTASDSCPLAPALDLLLQEQGLRPVDWDRLASIQACLMEQGNPLQIFDPYRCLPGHPLLERRTSLALDKTSPYVAIHWKQQEHGPSILRVAMPIVHIGIGFRKDVSADELEMAYLSLLRLYNIEPLAIFALASIEAKAAALPLQALAKRHKLPVDAWEADKLAGVKTPNPSSACARRFGTQAFSVSEAAAILSANRHGKAILWRPKIVINGRITFAVALDIRTG